MEMSRIKFHLLLIIPTDPVWYFLSVVLQTEYMWMLIVSTKWKGLMDLNVKHVAQNLSGQSNSNDIICSRKLHTLQDKQFQKNMEKGYL